MINNQKIVNVEFPIIDAEIKHFCSNFLSESNRKWQKELTWELKNSIVLYTCMKRLSTSIQYTNLALKKKSSFSFFFSNNQNLPSWSAGKLIPVESAFPQSSSRTMSKFQRFMSYQEDQCLHLAVQGRGREGRGEPSKIKFTHPQKKMLCPCLKDPQSWIHTGCHGRTGHCAHWSTSLALLDTLGET